MLRAHKISNKPDSSDSGNFVGWVGVCTRGKNFIWWANTSDTLDNLVVFFTNLFLVKGIEAAVGQGIHFENADNIHVHPENIRGVYIEERYRTAFTLELNLGGLPKPEATMAKNVNRWAETQLVIQQNVKRDVEGY